MKFSGMKTIEYEYFSIAVKRPIKGIHALRLIVTNDFIVIHTINIVQNLKPCAYIKTEATFTGVPKYLEVEDQRKLAVLIGQGTKKLFQAFLLRDCGELINIPDFSQSDQDQFLSDFSKLN